MPILAPRGRNGAGLLQLVALFAPTSVITSPVTVAAPLSIALLGAIGARAGGASMAKASRVTFRGALAMAVTAGISERANDATIPARP